MQLNTVLSKLFRPAKQRIADPGYRRFRKLVKAHNLSYKVAGDGFIEIAPCSALPRGLTTPHYGWDETADRVDHCIAHPEGIDQDGCYAE